jgi:hypothetical protein
MPRRVLTALVCLAFPLALAACRRQEAPAPPPAPPPAPAVQAPAPSTPAPFRVTGVQTGKAIGLDKRVTAPTTVFATTDPTIYVSVASDGSSPGMNLTARWLFEDGQVVNETTLAMAPTGPTASEFQISKPDGWPVGRYKVQILANGAPVAVQEFEVR